MPGLTGAQDCGLVPIVEPEILIDGEHGMRESSEAAERVLVACFQALREQAADLGGMLLKPQMIIPGSEFTGPKPSSRAIAEETLRVMRKYVISPQAASQMIMSFSDDQPTQQLCAEFSIKLQDLSRYCLRLLAAQMCNSAAISNKQPCHVLLSRMRMQGLSRLQQ